ncbi:probable lysophospholipase BODYGUARD 4 isoform X2 [Miscanthus floridulus]|uniref:probable lysophospholipase BODYGUARD 4 isoform X2 n=1 Tax=Miscanthus floridulus TaxID=154761 RepID=UPI00345A7A2A
MRTFPSSGRWSTSTTWPRRAAGAASTALASTVFAVLDVADVILCFVYALLDGVLEDNPVHCYCHRSYDDDDGISEATAAAVDGGDHEEVSDTLYAHGRRSAVRDALLGLLRLVVGRRGAAPPDEPMPPCKWRSPRWSDCACKSCVAWRGAGEGEAGGRLHVVVKEPDRKAAAGGRFADAAAGTRTPDRENAIFVHGFTSSSSFWAETVFRESSFILDDCRLFAVDLLGFGRSPKPANCMYRVRDHVEAIERSLIEPHGLMSGSASFHLVSHSMGCIIALALAAKHPTRVKSITLVAPPYFLPCEQRASQVALNRLAEKKLWPPLLFGSAVMSWYEHIGRTVCFLVCKNHLLWEWLFSLFTGNTVRDLTKHTHHSAWHTMHNVICGGARLQDANLEAVVAAGIPVQVVHGADDQVVPVECSRHLKAKLPRAKLSVMDRRDHSTVVLGRERDFAEELKVFWWSAASRSPVHVQDADVQRRY